MESSSLLPDRDRADGDLRVVQVAGEHGEDHHVPDLEAEHHGGRQRQPDERPNLLEGGRRQAGPPRVAPAHDVRHLRQRHHPRRDVEGGRRAAEAPPEREDEERQQADVEEEGQEADPGQRRDSALSLQELLRREVDGQREHLRDDADGELPGELRDLVFLADELQDRGGEDVERAHED